MILQRIDRLTAPPIVGERYLVRTVRGKYYNKVADWPVIGPRHEDADIFHFPLEHYHIDVRFLPETEKRAEQAMSGSPLHGHHDFPLGEIVLRRLKCKRATIDFYVPWRANRSPLHVLRSTYAGQQCAHGTGGFICPHRKAPLGSIAPIDGVITCPLHGLRIDAATGVVLPVTP